MCSLSYVHVYRIEYVSYRQGPYRIRIVSAADRIVPALTKTIVPTNQAGKNEVFPDFVHKHFTTKIYSYMTVQWTLRRTSHF